ncbi:hypothetical protein EDB85DRAFT_2244307 [Lactarius pseudohatsudake]|nr:hypothetical protein EDB85DRAFT_2244307 [Lactarius pseudohatsudake]
MRRQGLPLEAHANPFARSHIAIAMALCDPTIFDFDQLFEINAVLTAQTHPLFVLWTFLSGRLDTLHAWQKADTDTSRSVHDCDLNRAAGSSTENDPALWTMCRTHIRSPAVSSVGHALREDVGEYRIWISTSLLSPGAISIAHKGLSVSMLTPAALSIDYAPRILPRVLYDQFYSSAMFLSLI